jgi:hypothetical protein
MIIEPTDFILCGMSSELSVLTAAFPNNPVFGGTAKANLVTLVPSTCRRIISCGLGGGLSPKIAVAGGAVATTVTNGTRVWSCDRRWNDEILDAVNVADQEQAPWSRGFVVCPWYSSGELGQADTSPQRSALLAETGAWGIDDETYSALVFCETHPEVMLNVLRFCSDDASETLPLAARGDIMNVNGTPNMAYLWKELVSEGLVQDADLAKVAWDGNASLAALQQCVQELSPV